MRIHSNISAATDTAGTVYYKCSLDDIIDVISNERLETILLYKLQTEGFDCLNFDSDLYGSFVEDDILYLCVTDGYPITVNGKEIDPEEELPSTITVDDLASYIVESDDDIIKKHISSYELREFDVNELALDMLSDDYDLKYIVQGLDNGDFVDFEI